MFVVDVPNETAAVRRRLDQAYGFLLFVTLFVVISTFLILFMPDEVMEGLVALMIVASAVFLALGSIVGIVFSIVIRRVSWKLPFLSLYAAVVIPIIWVFDAYEPFGELTLASIIGGYFVVSLWFSLGWFLFARRRFSA